MASDEVSTQERTTAAAGEGEPAAGSRRLLIVRPSALGDVCRTVPLAASLRAAWPDATIGWVVQAGFEDAVRAHPAVDEVLSFPRHAGIRRVIVWLTRLRSWRADVAIDAQGLGRSGLITLASGARERIGWREAREGAWLTYTRRIASPIDRHAVERTLDLAEAAGGSRRADMSLTPPESSPVAARFEGRRYVVLAPTARWGSKTWPAVRFAELGDRLLRRGVSVVLLGAPGEEAAVARARPSGWPVGGVHDPVASDEGQGSDGGETPVCLDLCGATSVGASMAVIAGAAAVVAGDSAPLHMAAGLRVPVVALFGPTDRRLVGPRGDGPIVTLPPEDVEPVEPALYRRLGDDDRLMRHIEVDAVETSVVGLLSAVGGSGGGNSISPRETGALGVTAGSTGQDRAGSGGAARPRPAAVASTEAPDPPGTLWLASRSPRRRQLLAEAGVRVTVVPAGIDDGTLVSPRVPPRWWVAALAYLKARWVADHLRVEEPAARGLVLGADTVCVIDGRVIGQPADAAAAAATIRAIAGRTHTVLTGVAFVDPATGVRDLVVDEAVVRCGELSEAEIQSYVEGGAWRGKAGGYNLEERQAAGWPLTCIGDPHTVVGLPLRRIAARLAPWRGPAA